MNKTKWNKGKPPHVGWWQTQSNWWRWWDGSQWSYGASAHVTKTHAARIAKTKIPAHNAPNIEWCDYYPINARVPRVQP